MNKKEYLLYPQKSEGTTTTSPPIELPTSAILQIGDTTIIARAHYQEEGKNCAERLVNILLSEVKK